MNYVEQFLELNCAGDILNILGPIPNVEKEISEAMAIVNRIRSVALANEKITLVDLCSGNALVPVICAFLFKNVWATAVDIHVRERNWDRIERFKYVQVDILDEDKIRSLCTNRRLNINIMTGVHACKSLSPAIIGAFNSVKYDKLFLMPCCEGSSPGRISFEPMTTYDRWCFQLCQQVEGTVKCYVDKNIKSPKNRIIEADGI